MKLIEPMHQMFEHKCYFCLLTLTYRTAFQSVGGYLIHFLPLHELTYMYTIYRRSTYNMSATNTFNIVMSYTDDNRIEMPLTVDSRLHTLCWPASPNLLDDLDHYYNHITGMCIIHEIIHVIICNINIWYEYTHTTNTNNYIPSSSTCGKQLMNFHI